MRLNLGKELQVTKQRDKTSMMRLAQIDGIDGQINMHRSQTQSGLAQRTPVGATPRPPFTQQVCPQTDEAKEEDPWKVSKRLLRLRGMLLKNGVLLIGNRHHLGLVMMQLRLRGTLTAAGRGLESHLGLIVGSPTCGRIIDDLRLRAPH